MASTQRLACPHCGTPIDPSDVPNERGDRDDTVEEVRLKGANVECRDCGDAFALYFY